MIKYLRNIDVIIYLLKKTHRHAFETQILLYRSLSNNENYKVDSRITAFGLIRTIIFCAINDALYFRQNIITKNFIKIKNDLNEVFDEPFIELALRNYPIYNYIIRFQSSIETGSKKFMSNSDFKKFCKEIDVTKLNAFNILKAWRNTIHNNGILSKEEFFDYRNMKIIISKDHNFYFDFWTLYRVSIDSIDCLYEFCKKSLDTNPEVLIDHQTKNKKE